MERAVSGEGAVVVTSVARNLLVVLVVLAVLVVLMVALGGRGAS